MTSRALREVLVGLQTGPGSGANVDTALRATCDLKPNVVKFHPPEDIGSYAPARHYVPQIMPEGNIKLDGTYEQIIILLSMAMGEVTPPTWVWTLPDTLASAADFAVWTLEYTDGDAHVVRAEDVLATSLTIAGVAGRGWTVEATLGGGATTFPGALSATPTIEPVTPILMANTALTIDDTYLGIGSGAVDEFISFTWKLEEFQHTKQWGGSLYPNGRGNNKWKVTLELVIEVSATIAADLAAAFLAIDQFAVRIEADDGTSTATIDGMYMIENINTLEEEAGNNILKITLLGEKDTDNNTGEVTIVNTITEL